MQHVCFGPFGTDSASSGFTGKITVEYCLWRATFLSPLSRSCLVQVKLEKTSFSCSSCAFVRPRPAALRLLSPPPRRTWRGSTALCFSLRPSVPRASPCLQRLLRPSLALHLPTLAVSSVQGHARAPSPPPARRPNLRRRSSTVRGCHSTAEPARVPALVLLRLDPPILRRPHQRCDVLSPH
jgi:hypothetical protein